MRLHSIKSGITGLKTLTTSYNSVKNLCILAVNYPNCSGRKNLGIEVYDVCLVLCEQAVEKILKALYIKITGKEFPPKIHSLQKLMTLVEMQDELSELVIEIDDYYLALRYPDIAEEMPYELCDKDDANEGVEKAEKIIKIVRQRIGVQK